MKVFSGSFGCNSNFDISYDDDAASGTYNCGNINPVTLIPSSALSGFDGKSSFGTWT